MEFSPICVFVVGEWGFSLSPSLSCQACLELAVHPWLVSNSLLLCLVGVYLFDHDRKFDLTIQLIR